MIVRVRLPLWAPKGNYGFKNTMKLISSTEYTYVVEILKDQFKFLTRTLSHKMRVCLFCDEEFFDTSINGKSLYCCPDHQQQSQIKKAKVVRPLKTCKCGKTFEDHSVSNNRLSCDDCMKHQSPRPSRAKNRAPKKCPICKGSFLDKTTGSTMKFCPDCREEGTKATRQRVNARNNQRKGVTKALRCSWCGSYLKESGEFCSEKCKQLSNDFKDHADSGGFWR